MKTTALHYHSDETQCWFDWQPEQGPDAGWWLTTIPDDAPLDPARGIIPGLATGCPNPDEPDMPEIGRRDELLVAGNEPFTPPPAEEVVWLEAEGTWGPLPTE
jgi:hypothetical protein